MTEGKGSEQCDGGTERIGFGRVGWPGLRTLETYLPFSCAMDRKYRRHVGEERRAVGYWSSQRFTDSSKGGM